MSDTPPFLTDAGKAVAEMRELVSEHFRPTVVDVTDPITGVVVPAFLDKSGVHQIPAEVFDDYLPAPRFRAGTATLLDLDSFIHFVQRHSDEHSLIFAYNDRATPSITAILNYNETGAAGKPRNGDHRALHRFPLADEWKAWNAQNAKGMTQVDFGKFLEDHIIDVTDPGEIQFSDAQRKFVDRLGGFDKIAHPAQLVSLAMNFSVIDAQSAVTATTLQSGEMQIEIKSEHTDRAGQKLNVPSMFVIAIPVFKGGDAYQVLARLRYRVTNGIVTFFYELWRLDLVFDHAFDGAVKQVIDETGVPVLLGSPE